MRAGSIGAALLAALLAACGQPGGWSAEEKEILRDLRLVEGPPPPDPSNRFADDEAAARLGQRFFFDARFSANGQVSCATCHLPAKDFQDGLPLGKGLGTTGRRTMPIAGVAASPWFFWDGRKDSLWSQALGPLESDVEHGGDRLSYVRLVATAYRADYERVFGALPDVAAGADPDRDAVNRAFANIGKAIAAYERKLRPGPARFDRYVDAVLRGDDPAASRLLDDDEVAGLRLFIGEARCTQCHNGPRLTNDDFANTGVPSASSDRGRAGGIAAVQEDEFNCLGPYSDARPEQCGELRALRPGAHNVRAFKVPTLRNVAGRAPYMHAGQLRTLEEVVEHYDRAPAAPAGHSELRPLRLSPGERRQLVRFLGTLSAPLATEASWLRP